jgi:hypothetical protein
LESEPLKDLKEKAEEEAKTEKNIPPESSLYPFSYIGEFKSHAGQFEKAKKEEKMRKTNRTQQRQTTKLRT